MALILTLRNTHPTFHCKIIPLSNDFGFFMPGNELVRRVFGILERFLDGCEIGYDNTN